MVAPKCETICGGGSSAAAVGLVAGEVEFDGFAGAPAPFAFLGGNIADPAEIPLGTLNPDSNLFASPSPGALQYVGTSPLRARVSYSLSLVLSAITGGVTAAPLVSTLVLNGAIVGKTTQGEVLNVTDTETFFGHTADGMLVLQPGDILQVGLVSIVPETFSLLISSLTIVANQV